MAKTKSVAVEAESDPQPGAESPAPEATNANGAVIRQPEKVAAQEDSTSVSDLPAEVEPAPKPVPPKPYGDGRDQYPRGTDLFAYEPKGGGEKIYLPLDFEKPDKVWLWELNIQPFLSQTWAWLDRAGTPRSVQRQCVSLPDDEYMDMFGEWFKAMGGGATPGE
jgi:hypothetical protein